MFGPVWTALSAFLGIAVWFIWLDVDPALGIGPLATALQDVVSIVIYFLLALVLL